MLGHSIFDRWGRAAAMLSWYLSLSVITAIWSAMPHIDRLGLAGFKWALVILTFPASLVPESVGTYAAVFFVSPLVWGALGYGAGFEIRRGFGQDEDELLHDALGGLEGLTSISDLDSPLTGQTFVLHRNYVTVLGPGTPLYPHLSKELKRLGARWP